MRFLVHHIENDKKVETLVIADRFDIAEGGVLVFTDRYSNRPNQAYRDWTYVGEAD